MLSVADCNQIAGCCTQSGNNGVVGAQAIPRLLAEGANSTFSAPERLYCCLDTGPRTLPFSSVPHKRQKTTLSKPTLDIRETSCGVAEVAGDLWFAQTDFFPFWMFLMLVSVGDSAGRPVTRQLNDE